METKKTHIPKVPSGALLMEIANSVKAGSILNIFYSALILKRLSGIEITPDIEREVIETVSQQYQEVLDKIVLIQEAVFSDQSESQ